MVTSMRWAGPGPRGRPIAMSPHRSPSAAHPPAHRLRARDRLLGAQGERGADRQRITRKKQPSAARDVVEVQVTAGAVGVAEFTWPSLAVALVPSITAEQGGPPSLICMWLMLPVATPPLKAEKFTCQGKSVAVRINVTPRGRCTAGRRRRPARPAQRGATASESCSSWLGPSGSPSGPAESVSP
jgi:hypothetical protein